MSNIEVKVKTEDKILEINGSSLDLDPSLIGTELSTLPKGVGDKVLELQYKENKNDFLFEEYNKIYGFLEQKNLTKHLDAYPCPEGVEFPTIAITGNFNAYISK
jgi:hypothetical protein